jgi:hypothetical protein
MTEKNVTYQYFWGLRRAARCGLSASGQPDITVGNTATTKGKPGL